MNRIYNNPIFSSVMIFTLTSYLFSSLAFIIPQWYGTWPGALSSFQNIGLWEVCFYSLMQEDVYDKIYTDCFHLDYSAISDLKSWIITNWFRASQIHFTINFVCLMVASFLFVAMSVGSVSLRRRKYAIMLAALHCVSWLTCLITLVLFGSGTSNLTEDQWMPNPDQCHLSWSYGAAALSLLGNMICLVQLAFVIKTSRNGLIFWSCSKSFIDGSGEDTLPIDTRHSVGVPVHSLYDPRGDSSSRCSANKEPSVMSRRLNAPTPNKYQSGSRHGASLLSEDTKAPLSMMSKTSDNDSQAPSAAPKHHFAKKPVKETKSSHEDSIAMSDLSKQSIHIPAKTFSPPPSHLTVSNISGTTSVIAAKHMKKK